MSLEADQFHHTEAEADDMTDPTPHDDWTKVVMRCQKCGKEFFRKVKGQMYCDEHRHLAGQVVKLTTACAPQEGEPQ